MLCMEKQYKLLVFAIAEHLPQTELTSVISKKDAQCRKTAAVHVEKKQNSN